jgi:hypothetical protein
MVFDYTANDGTDAEMLVAVRAAIVRVTVVGQSYVIRNRTYTDADLRELRLWETALQRRITNASSGMARNIARNNRRF